MSDNSAKIGIGKKNKPHSELKKRKPIEVYLLLQSSHLSGLLCSRHIQFRSQTIIIINQAVAIIIIAVVKLRLGENPALWDYSPDERR